MSSVIRPLKVGQAKMIFEGDFQTGFLTIFFLPDWSRKMSNSHIGIGFARMLLSGKLAIVFMELISSGGC